MKALKFTYLLVFTFFLFSSSNLKGQGNALDFDGIDDYAQAPDIAALDLTTALTMEAWVKIDVAPAGTYSIISKFNPDASPEARSYSLFIGNDLNLAMGVSGDGVNIGALFGEIPLQLGTWHHVAGVFSPGQLILYVDGNDAGSTTTNIPSTLYSGSAPLTFGTSSNTVEKSPGTIDEAVNMDLDEVRIWNQSLTQSEIQTNMFNELIGSEMNLVAYYDFNASTGTTLADNTSNANTATLFNNNNNTPPADGSANGPVWISSGAFELTPIIYNATNASINGFTANFLPVVKGGVSAIIDIDDNADFTSPFATNIGVIGLNATTSSYFVSQDLSSYQGQQLYYRMEYQDGMNTGNSDTLSFMVGAGNALPFNDASSQYVNIPDTSSLEAASVVTLSAWVRRTDLTTLDIILEKGGDWNLGETNYGMALHEESTDNGMFYFFWDGGVVGTDSELDYEWHHYAAVANETTDVVSLYVDGNLRSNLYSNGSSDVILNENTTRDLHIGAQIDGGATYYGNAVIDEVQIWDIERFGSEIQPAQYRTLRGSESGLLAYYRFDEVSTSSTLPDFSLNGNEGTLTNMTGNEWLISGAMAPLMFEVSAASTSGYTVNWDTTRHGNGNVLLDVNTAADFSGVAITTGEIIGNSDAGKFSTLSSLTANTRYYARTYIRDGNFQSPYSEVVDFFPGAGNALPFAGGDYISVPHDPNFDIGPFTVEFWFNNTVIGNFIIIEKGSNNEEWSIQQSSGGAPKILLNIGNNITQASGSYNDGNWHHAAVVYRGVNDASIYIDGIDDTNLTNVGTPDYATYDGEINIGGRGGLSTFIGSLDEIRIWNDERTLPEINENLFTTLSGLEEGLVAYYRFDEESGTILPDLAGQGLDGTLNNMTGTEWAASGALQSTAMAAAPDSLIAYRSSATEVILEWSDNSNNETGFLIERANDFGFGSATTITTVPPNINTYTFAAGANQAYYYRVTALATGGNTNSNVGFATTETYPAFALTFDGTDDQINVVESDNSLDLTTTATFEMWVNRTSGVGTDIQTLIDKTETGDNANFRVFINDESNALNPNSVGFWDGTTSYHSPAFTISNSEWTHIAITLDGTDIRFYENGNLVETLAGTLGATNNGDLIIGNESFNPSERAFNGQMDEVRIWNIVKNDFSDRFQSLNGNEANLVAYYPLDENAPNATILDRSKQTNNGAPSGSPVYAISGATAPSNLLVSETSQNQIDLSWTDNTNNETGFVIDRSLSADFSSPTTFNVGVNETAYTDLTVTPSNTYYYRVRADLPGAVASGYTLGEQAGTYGIPGNALDFDGGSDFVQIGQNALINFERTDAFTFEGWFNNTPTGSAQLLFGNILSDLTIKGYGVFVHNNGAISVYITDDDQADSRITVLTDDQGFNDGSWHHVAVSYTGSSTAAGIQVLVDGAIRTYTVGNDDLITGSIVNGNDLFLGSRNGTDWHFNGLLDEVRVWNDVRSVLEIQNNRFASMTGSEANLVAYYDFDQGIPAGTNTGLGTLLDQTGNGLDGMLNTFGLNGASSNWVASGAMNPSSPPLAPSDLIAYKSTDTEITLSWIDNATDEQGYRVEVSTDYAFSGSVQVADLPAGTTTYNHTVSYDDQFFYRVTAYNGAATAVSAIEFGTSEDYPGRKLEFDGIDDYVNVPTGGQMLDNLSIWSYEAWIRIEDRTKANGLFSLGGSSPVVIQIDATGRIQIRDQTNTGNFQTATGVYPDDGQWHHVAVTNNGNNSGLGAVYVDGVSVSMSNNAFTTFGNTSAELMQIGSWDLSVNEFFQGDMDEVRFWNTARTSMEIQNNIYTRLQGNESGLIGYFTFDENAGSITVDRSTNNHDGTINGAQFDGSDFTQPSDVYVTRLDNQNLQINWTNNWNEDGIRIVRATDYDGANNATVTTLSSAITSYTHNIGTDTSSFYLIEAYKGADTVQSVVEFGSTYAYPGFAMEFDGVGDYINIPDSDNLSFGDGTSDAPMAVEAWINLDQINAQGIISKRVGGQDEWHFVISSDSRLSVTLADESANAFLFGESSVVAFNTGQWYHVAFSYNGSGSFSDIRLFLDGVELSNSASSSSGAYTAMENTISDVQIGTFNSGAGFNFNGQIDELKIWDFAKTTFTDRFTRPNGNEAGLVAYYAFDENTNSAATKQVVDRSINANDGTLNGDPQWATSTAGLLSAPSNLTAFVNSTPQPQLDWDDVAGAVSYIIERSQGDNNAYTQVGTPTSSDFTDATVPSDGEVYFYRIAAFDGTNNSPYSGEAIADIKGPGAALDFNGVVEAVSIDQGTSLSPGSGDYTMSFWFNVNAITASQQVLVYSYGVGGVGGGAGGSENDLFGFVIDATGELVFNVRDAADAAFQEVRSGFALEAGDWYHTAAVINRTNATIDIYLNGISIQTVTLTETGSIDPANAITLGASELLGSIGYELFFGGTLDDLKIWNTAFTQSQIRSEMYATDLTNAFLRGYWDLDQVEGTTVQDIVGTNNGSMVNMLGDNTDWIKSDAYEPFIFEVTDANSNGFSPNWLQVDNASGYTIDYGTDPSFASFNTATINHNDSTTNISTTLTAGTEYFTRIRYNNGNYTSDTSEVVTFYATPGYMLDFDGTDDEIDLSSHIGNLDFDAPATFEFWHQSDIDHLAQNEIVFSIGNGTQSFYLAYGNATAAMTNERMSAVHTQNNSSDVTFYGYSDATNVIGQWHHYAVVATGTEYLFYVDGALVPTTASSWQNNNPGDYGDNFTATTARIGSFIGISGFVDGRTDEFRIWNDVRTLKEISDNLFTTLVGNEESLVAYYRFDEQSGTDVQDHSVNGLDGTWSGPSSPNLSPNWQLSTAFSADNFVVTNTGNLGPGSLRQAIIDANGSSADLIEITFNISGAGPWNIAPTTALPAITNAGVILDGSTQPGWDFDTENMPTLDYTSLASTNGLDIQAADVEIYGLVILDAADGIVINGDAADNVKIGAPGIGNIFLASNAHDITITEGDNLTVQGNYFGINGNGTTANAANSGIVTSGTVQGVQIGGTVSSSQGNWFAGSSGSNSLIDITAGASDIMIQGNTFGLAPADSVTDLTVSRGVTIINASNITIGGTSPDFRNVFGGINTQGAMYLQDVSTANVQYNFVGVSHDGLRQVTNATYGVSIGSGTSTNVTISDNVLSGNDASSISGVYLNGLTASSVTIDNNIIGLDSAGNNPIPNDLGIFTNGAGGTIVITNNVISGNGGDGIYTLNAASDGYTIQGNYIGTDITGLLDRANTGYGLRISGGSENHQVGGTGANQGNVIAGDGIDGVFIEGGSGGHIFQKNIIGRGSDNSTPLGGFNYGFNIRNTNDVTIGGAGANEGNLIANTNAAGVFLYNSTTNTDIIGNTFSNNPISIQFSNTGTPNNDQGHPYITEVDGGVINGIFRNPAVAGDQVHVYSSASAIHEPEFLEGSFTATGGETTWSIVGTFDNSRFFQAALTNNTNGTSELSVHYVVRNNADAGDGSLRDAIDSLNVTRNGGGISFELASANDVIALTSGQLPALSADMIIDASTQTDWDLTTGMLPTISNSCSCNDGLETDGDGSAIQIYGLRIVGFNSVGIRSFTSSGPLTVGAPGKGNVIISNAGGGVRRYSATDFVLQGNYIGVDWNGDLGANAGDGVHLSAGGNAMIGGSNTGEGNVISGSTGDGIFANTASSLQIIGNYIGTDPTGTLARPNATAGGASSGGLFFGSVSSNHDIIDNVISGNNTNGIFFQGNDNDTIQGNRIGVDVNGDPLGNGTNGIHFSGTSSNNLVGGSGADANTIANNAQYAIRSENNSSLNNKYLSNSIFGNTLGGIIHGTSTNGSILPPTIDPIASSGSSASGTGTNGDEIELFTSDGTGQGQSLLGTATVSSGVWNMGSLSLNPGDQVVATTTNSTNGTSVFSSVSSVNTRNSLHFDGINDQVTSTNNHNLLGDVAMSLAAWVRLDALAGAGAVMSLGVPTTTGGAFALFVNNDGSVSANFGSGQNVTTGPGVITAGNWHHVGIAKSPGSIDMQTIIVVDGVQQTGLSATSNITNSLLNSPVHVGYHSINGAHINARIDEAFVFNLALSESDFNMLKDDPNTALGVAYVGYDVESCSGTALPDVTGNNLHGTLENFGFVSGSNWENLDTPVGSAPVTQASGINITNASETEFTVNWNNGTGNRTVVFVKQTASAENESPTNGVTYLSASNFTSGTELSPSFYTVHNGYGNSAVVRGLTELTDYRVLVMSYNDCYGSEQYNTTTTESQNALNFQTPKFENAMDFDGTDQITTVASVAEGQTDLTVEAWIYPTTYPDNDQARSIVTDGNYASGTSTFAMLLNDANGQDSLAIILRTTMGETVAWISVNTYVPLNQWTHTAFSWTNGGAIRTFINGTEVGNSSSAISGSTATSTDDLIIGSNTNGAEQNFIGLIDEVRIWNVPKDQQAVRDDMFAEFSGPVTNLLANYNFNDGLPSGDNTSLTTTADISLGNSGDITSFTRSGATSNFVNSTAFTSGFPNSSVSGNGIDIPAGNTPRVADGTQLIGETTLVTQTFRITNNGLGSQGLLASNPVVPGGTGFAVVAQPSGSTIAPFGFLDFTVSYDPTQGTNSGTFTILDDISNPIASIVMEGRQNPIEPGSGYALAFNGSSEFVTITDTATLQFGMNDFTIEGWFYFDGSNQLGPLVQKRLNTSPFNQFFISISNGNAYSPVAGDILTAGLLPDGRALSNAEDRVLNSSPLSAGWHHFALVQDYDLQAELFVDGVSQGTSSVNHNNKGFDVVGSNLFFGHNGLTEYFTGQLDEIRIWSEARTETQIRSHLAQKFDINSLPASLVSYYRFDENTGTALYDLKGGNHGTLTGTTSQTSGAFIGDESTFTTGAQVTLNGATSGNNLTIDNLAGTPDVAYVYRVNQAPNNILVPSGMTSLNSADYYGVFMAGGTNPRFGFKLDYSGNSGIANENGFRIAYRPNNTEGTFVRRSTFFDLDVANDSILMTSQPAGEFIQGLSPQLNVQTFPGAALNFDGITDFVQVASAANSFNLGSTFTYEVWINTTDTNGEFFANFVDGGQNEGTLFGIDATGRLQTFVSDGSSNQTVIDTGSPVNGGVWHHVAVTYDGSNFQFYIDGVASGTVASTLANRTVGNSTNVLRIGRDNNGSPSRFYAGDLDELRIWDDVLSQPTINAYRNQGIDGSHPNLSSLKAYYTFDEGVGEGNNGGITTPEIDDYSENGFSGIMQTFAKTGTASNWITSGAAPPPTVVLSSLEATATNNPSIPITITFSESVTGFVQGDIVVSGGTISSFADTNPVFTFNLDVSAPGAYTIDVPAGVAQDTDLLSNTASNQLLFNFDGASPTPTISSTESGTTILSPFNVTVNWDEDVNNFIGGDVTVGNGSVSGFLQNTSSNYTVNITPMAAGPVTVDVAAGVAEDTIMNPSLAATQFSINYVVQDPLVVYNGNDTGAGSLRDVVANATSLDTITFFSGTNWNTTTIQLNTAIDINKILTIDGTNGPITINQNGANERIFTVTEGTQTNPSVLRSLVLQGGNGVSGGAVHVSGTLSKFLNIVDVFFTGNTAGTNDGGALYIDFDEVVNVANSTFYNNNAVNGGGIQIANGGNLVITNSSVINNVATNLGGGINQVGNYLQTTNVTITQNQANQYGGIHMTGVQGSPPSTQPVEQVRNTIVLGNIETGPVSGNADVFVSSLANLDEASSGNNILGNTATAAAEFGTNTMVGELSATHLGVVSMAGPNGSPHYPLNSGSVAVDFSNGSYLGLDVYDVDRDGNVAENVPLDAAGNNREQGNEIDLGSVESAFTAFFATANNHTFSDLLIGPNETNQAFYAFRINPNGASTLQDVQISFTTTGQSNILNGQAGIGITTAPVPTSITPVATTNIDFGGGTINFTGINTSLTADTENYVWITVSTTNPITDGLSIQGTSLNTLTFIESVTLTNNVSGGGSTRLFQTPDGFPYCDPTSSPMSSSFPPGLPIISDVSLEGISHSTGSDQSAYYFDFSNQSTDITIGESYVLTVTPTNLGNDTLQVYVDWDQDQILEENELIQDNLSFNNGDPIPINFTVPLGATLGSTRMRIMTWNHSSTLAEVVACGQQGLFPTTLAGGQVEDYSLNILTNDNTAPVITVSDLTTEDRTPALSGTIDDATASIVVNVNGVNYNGATISGSTWTLADNTIASLTPATYPITVTATDPVSNIGNATGTLIIEGNGPVVTLSTTSSSDLTPALNGTIDDVTSTIAITVNNETYTATNNGDGTWSLADNTVSSLDVGSYTIIGTGTDTFGNEGTFTSTLDIIPSSVTASTAASLGTVSFVASWSRAFGGVSNYQLDVSTSLNFTSFVTGYESLAVTDTFQTVTGLDYTTNYYYRVRVLYNSGDVSENSNTVTVTTATDPGTAQDSTALVSIYNSTGGSSWTDNTNWLTGRLSTWQGVTMTEARITAVDLSSNNLTGAIGDITEGLDALTTLNLSGNQLTNIGALTSLTSLSSADVSSNDLEFGSLENVRNQTTNLTFLDQGIALEASDALVEIGQSFTIDRSISGSNNTYAWFRGNTSIDNTGGTLTVTPTSPDDEGIFRAEVTNSNFPGLTITTADFELKVSSIERDQQALLNIYNTLDAANTWTNGADWPNNGDITTWVGVVVDATLNRVTELDLSGSNVIGDMPDDLQDIGGLTRLDLSNNEIGRLPDISSLTLSQVNVSSNRLDFGDLEPNITILGGLENYDNQGLIGAEDREELVARGNDFTLSLTSGTGGTANTYSWTRLNALGSTSVGDGTNNVSIDNIRYENMGIFTVQVSNTIVPGLTLESHPINVFATARLDGNITDENGGPLPEGSVQALRIPFTGEDSRGYDSLDAIAVVNGSFTFGELVLGDLLLSTRVEDGTETYLPTYFGNTPFFTEASTIELREDFSITGYQMQLNPPGFEPGDGDGEVGLGVESDFAEDRQQAREAGRLSARRKLQKVGCSLRRRRRATGGRDEGIANDDEFELVVYKETDADGRVTFENLPPDTYRLNIEYPGIPMDPDSFIEFEVGEGGLENNTLQLEATVDENGIAVELVEELGFYRHYFKDLELYPNPVDRELTIRYSKLLSEHVRVQLLNLQGRLIKEERVGRGYNQEMVLDTQDVEEGIYLVRFIDPTRREGNNIVTYKIIVKRR